MGCVGGGLYLPSPVSVSTLRHNQIQHHFVSLSCCRCMKTLEYVALRLQLSCTFVGNEVCLRTEHCVCLQTEHCHSVFFADRELV